LLFPENLEGSCVSASKDARRRKFDVVVTWKFDRLGRNLKHLITLLDDLQALGVAFVSLNEGIDATTPAGRLQMHVLGAIPEFERGRIVERVRAGLARAKAQGNASAASRMPSPTPSSRRPRTGRSGTRPRPSVSLLGPCIGGGCHANPRIGAGFALIPSAIQATVA
jgi:hypothetical protein